MASWSKAGNEHELSEVTTSAIRMMDEDSQKGLLFAAIRGMQRRLKLLDIVVHCLSLLCYVCVACELNAIRNVLQVNRNLVHAKMYGYEGSDVFEIIKNVNKCDSLYLLVKIELSRL